MAHILCLIMFTLLTILAGYELGRALVLFNCIFTNPFQKDELSIEILALCGILVICLVCTFKLLWGLLNVYM